MPREFTHWVIAEKVCSKLGNTVFSKPINKYKNLVLLGSNFHDTLYYYYKINKKNEISKIPQILHGSYGNDTFEIVKNISNVILKTELESDKYIAFLVGIISHIFTDSIFHPMVFNLAGHYSKDKKMKAANQRHHQLEALIDFYLGKEIIDNRNYDLFRMVRQAKNDLNSIIENLSREMNNRLSKSLFSAIINGYVTLGITQQIGMNKVFNKLCNTIYHVLPRIIKDIVSIRYDRRLLGKIEMISEKIKYLNPFSGEEENKTIDELVEIAVNKSVDFCILIDPFLKNKIQIDLNITGPSLKTGLINAPVKGMKYFSDRFLLD